MNLAEEIRFEFLPDTKVAGMAEPWPAKIKETIAMLRANGVGAVVTLTETNPLGKAYVSAGMRHLFSPIDDCEPPTAEAMDGILDFIDKALADGLGVAVHCLEGRGRTGTILGVWLGKRLGLSGPDAVETTYRLRYHTVITPSQREFMAKYLGNGGNPDRGT